MNYSPDTVCIPYNPQLKELARKHRKNPTKAEKIIWENILRKKQVGYLFLRQKPLGPFIADFYCANLRLVIEIDGGYHLEQKEYDQDRTQFLNQYDVEVIRYTNEAVLEDLKMVKKDILCELEKRRNVLSANPPSLLSQGGTSDIKGEKE